MSRVREVLETKGREVVCVSPAESVLAVARLMCDRGIGGVVISDGGDVAGIFTERDLLRRVVVAERAPATTTMREVMTAPVETCTPDTPLDRCADLLMQRGIRYLPVESEDGLCGIITGGDILASKVREQEDTLNFLNNYVFDPR
jgi:CBS domain-containing protein